MPSSLPTLVNCSAVVAEQHVRRVTERDEQIEVAVVVVVDPRHLARFAHRIDAEGRGDVREVGAVAIVAIESVARSRAAGEADVQIDVAVAVEVAPRGGACVGEVGNPRRRRDLHECSAVVAIQAIGLPVLESDEQIQIAVAVDVRPGVGLPPGGGEQLRLHQLELRGAGRRLRHHDQHHDRKSHHINL